MPSHRRTDVVALIDELTRVIEQGGELVGSGQEARKVVEIIVGFLKSQERGNAPRQPPPPPRQLTQPVLTPCPSPSLDDGEGESAAGRRHPGFCRNSPPVGQQQRKAAILAALAISRLRISKRQRLMVRIIAPLRR